MGELKEFDILKYQTEKGDVYLDNLRIRDCNISGKPCKIIYIANCTFRNVIFEDFFQYCDVNLEESRFQDCEFHGAQGQNCKAFDLNGCTFKNVFFDNQFKDSLVAVQDCKFRHCKFRGMLGNGDIEFCTSQFRDSLIENISTGMQGDSALVAECEFHNCNLKNIEIKREIEFTELNIRGGKIEHFHCVNSDIQECNFFDVHMEEVYLEANFLDNDMDSVIFRNVTLKGTMRDKTDIDENVFVNCDTSVLHICRQTERRYSS